MSSTRVGQCLARSANTLFEIHQTLIVKFLCLKKEQTLMTASLTYLHAAQHILTRILETELDAIDRAAEICAHTIAHEGLVHMFATGHSRMFVEEMYPRHGSFPGFHPIVELSLTYHNQVVGSNGQRQAMYLEHLEGFAPVILRNFVLDYPDSFLIFSNSGVNEVVVEMAQEAKKRDLPVIAVISKAHSAHAAPKHSSGQKLSDIADVTIDNGTPAGDAMVTVEGLDDPVGPGSTIGAAAVTNALKCAIAEKLASMGHTPLTLTSSYFVGAEESQKRFNESYDDYRRRLKRVYGCE
jgi:uncharacterized phosphosugar-binding protein